LNFNFVFRNAGRSAVFKRMFESDMSESKEGTMLLEDIGGDTMEICLEFIYGATLNAIKTKSADVASEIIYAADKVF
jgi:hypothetical protein